MRLDDYHQKDGKRVWLTSEEIDAVIAEADSPEQRIAFTLAGKGGLRSGEVIAVRRQDFTQAPDGFVRVWEDFNKTDTYREAPIPDSLTDIVRTHTHGSDPEDAVIKTEYTQTVYRWLRRAAERLEDETGDEGWQYLDVHDLRRSWGGHLLWDCGVSPMCVMEFGGWSDWQTFEQHYMGEMTPQAQERERSKVDFYGGEPRSDEAVFSPQSPAASATYGRSN
jgi:integrase